MLWPLLRRHLAPYGGELRYVLFLQLVATIAALYLPTLNADIIDNGVVNGDTGYILRVGRVMLAASLVQVVATVAAVYFGSRAAMGLGRDLRAALFHRVGEFSAREMAHFGAPTLITRNTNDTQQLQMVTAMALTMVATAPIMMVGGIVMALREDVGLSWLVLAAVPILGVSIALIATRLVPGFQSMQKSIDQVNRILREQATGMRVLRAFVREDYETRRFDGANTDLTEVSLRVGRLMAAFFPIVMLVLNLSSVAVLWFGGLRVDSGAMEIGSLTAFITYLLQILMAVMMATFMFVMLPRATVSARRIGEVLGTESSVRPPIDAVERLPETGVIKLDQVTFAYPGAEEPVVQNVSVEARRGETLALIGSTGAGKTTLVGLSRGCSTLLRDRSRSTASTCDASIPRRCGRESGWSLRPPICSLGPWPPISVSASQTPRRRRCGRPSRWRKPANSWRRCPSASSPPSLREEPTCRAGSVSASRSHVP